MEIKLGSQLPLALSLLLLLSLQLSLPLCAARKLHDYLIVYPEDRQVKTTEQTTTELIEAPTEQPRNDTRTTEHSSIEQSTKQTKVNATEQTKSKAPTIVQNPEIGPRITLDTLPICGEGFKLSGNHCRKEA